MKPLLSSLFLAFLLILNACSSVPTSEDVELWQAQTIAAQKDTQRTLIRELHVLDRQREENLELEQSRSRCLALLQRFPDAAPVLWRAARAESDYLLVLHSRKASLWKRNLAALSSLRYVLRAQSLLREDNRSSALLSQLAWSKGNCAHLKGLFEKSRWAKEILQDAEAALNKTPNENRALATLSILHRRLATRSDFTRVFTMSAPKGDLQKSLDWAKRCVASRPSLENQVLLARAHIALSQFQEADDLLQKALKRSDRFPRDRYYREQAMKILDRTTRELNKYQF